MNFETSETRNTIAHSIRDFAKKNIKPFMMDWDENQTFPEELFHQLGAMGFMGVLVPEVYGGSGMDYHEYITVIEEISKVDSSIGLSLAAHNSLCTNHILEFGNETQKAGIPIEQLDAFYNYCSKELKLNILGLMAIPPNDKNAKKYFKYLNELNKSLALENLSMGMSADYMEAIKHGSTFVRIGSSIFGPRS